MELPYRTEKLTFDLIAEAGPERKLAIEAAKFAADQLLVKPEADRLKANEHLLIGYFQWDVYCEARSWIEGHAPLSATLRLRKSIPPWAVRH